jgi:hypothetical protein
MIVPMSGFFIVLALLGGFTVLLSGSSAYAAKQLPLAFSMLFAGIGYCLLALLLYPLAFYMGNILGFVLLFFAPFVAGLSGAILGYRAGLKRVAKARA